MKATYIPLERSRGSGLKGGEVKNRVIDLEIIRLPHHLTHLLTLFLAVGLVGRGLNLLLLGVSRRGLV